MSDDGEDYILEVKTSSNLAHWVDGVPDYYYWQVALYNRFIAKQDKAYVALGIMDNQSLRDPDSWIPTEKNCTLFVLPINQAEVEEKLGMVRDWYDKYIAAGITPDYDPSNPGDVAMWEHLVSLTDSDESIAYLIEEDMKVRDEIAKYEDEFQAYYEEKKRLDAKLKDYLLCHELQAVDSSSGRFRAMISQSTRIEFDEEAMRADGIDPSKYKIFKTTKSFTIKPIKNTKKED
jgi:hypothetical protein